MNGLRIITTQDGSLTLFREDITKFSCFHNIIYFEVCLQFVCKKFKIYKKQG